MKDLTHPAFEEVIIAAKKTDGGSAITLEVETVKFGIKEVIRENETVLVMTPEQAKSLHSMLEFVL